MTRDEIMALAEKVGLTDLSLIDVAYLESFAELVAAVEREACANECENFASEVFLHAQAPYKKSAKAIRARGET